MPKRVMGGVQMPKKYVPPAREAQRSLFAPQSGWEAPRVADLPSWQGQPRVGFDVETRDPDLRTLGPGVRRGAVVVGYSFAFEDGRKFYVPLRHAIGGNVEDPEQAVAWLRNEAKHFTGELVGANLSYDLDFAAEMGVVFPVVGWYRDVQVADPLINELYRRYSLDAIAARWDEPLKNEQLLKEAATDFRIDPKKDLWKMPARFVGPYAEDDALIPLRILKKQEVVIERQCLRRVWDLESRVLPVLVAMRRRGVKIDFDHLSQIEIDTNEQESMQCSRIHELTGIAVGIGECGNNRSMEKVLNHIGITPGRTPKSDEPKINAELLESLDHEVAGCILMARRQNKLRTTFCKSIRRHAIRDRIHCSFEQLKRTEDDGNSFGTVSGRLSSRSPNLQQQPTRHKIARQWRKIYLPDEGGIWGCLDFSQQEPRLLVHFAEKTRCLGAAAAGEIYRTNPDADNHNMMTELVHPGVNKSSPEYKACRTACKTIFLGLCYGMQGASLSRKLGLSTQITLGFRGRKSEVAGVEAQAIIDNFNANVPYVSEMFEKVRDAAAQDGFIFTLMGRRCRFPRDEAGNFDWTYKALNRLIQGSAADQAKEAMVQASDAGFDIQLAVHDELDLTVKSRKEAEEMAVIMRDAVSVSVPMKVDVECGPSWGEIS